MYARSLRSRTDKSFFLFGPRGTGKSTWVRDELQPQVTIDLLASRTYTRLLADPQALESLIPLDIDGVVAIDEVQRVPMLLNEVHRLIESRRLVFVLTGSSARTLRRPGVNLLAGRALTHRLHPLTACELGDDFDLEFALRFGHLPATKSEPDPDAFLHSYVETYLREELMHEGLVRNLAAFTRFLRAASFSHAGQLSIAEVARDCSVDRRTAGGWFDVLEDLLLAVRIQPFSKRARRAVVSHPKLFLFDAGVYRAIRPRGPLDSPEEIAGAALEGFIFQELRACNDYRQLGYDLHFWRTRGGSEVDFILYGERGLVAIEVKHADTIRNRDLSGLKAFANDYPEARLMLVYMGHRREQRGEIAIHTAADFCRRLPELL